MLVRVTSFCLFILLFHTASYAQEDTSLVDGYIKIGWSIRTSNLDSAIGLADKALQLSEQIDYTDGLLKSHNLIAAIYLTKGQYVKALKHRQLQGEIVKDNNDTAGLAIWSSGISTLYQKMGDTRLALEHNLKAIAFYNQTANDVRTAAVYHNRGAIYEVKKMYDSALYYYNSAYEKNKKYNDSTPEIGLNISSISVVYSKKNMPEEALMYARLSLKVTDYKNNYTKLIYAYQSMAQALYANKQYNEAIKYATKTIDIAKEKGLNTRMTAAYLVRYKSYKQLGKYNSALADFELYKEWKDSLVNKRTYKELSLTKTQLVTEQKNKELAQKEKELLISENARERNRLFLVASLLLAIFISIAAYQIYKRQKLSIKAKNIELDIEHQEKELIALELKNQELKNNELNKEVLSYSLTASQKNQLLEDIKQELNNIKTAVPNELRKVKNTINEAIQSEEEWEEFKVRFEQVHQSFFKKIKDVYPQLTANDLRLCAFVKLNLNSKQIASLLKIAPSSVDIYKYRLKKKLNLEKGDSLFDFIEEISKS